MELRFLGTGAAFNPLAGNTGAFFTRGDDLFLIDCGEQTFCKLFRAGLLSGCKGQITVLQTHLHSDHSGSLGSLALYAAEVLKRPLVIVHPNEDIRVLLRIMGAVDGQYTLVPELSRDGFTATPAPTRHAPVIPAYSYYLRDEGGTVYYSGDSAEFPPDVADGLRDGSIAHAYQDAYHFEKEPANRPPHLLYSDLIRLVAPERRHRVTLMHTNVDFEAIATADGFCYAAMDSIFA